MSYIVYTKSESADNVIKSADKNRVLYASTVENPIITGYALMCGQYNRSFPDVKKLQDDINLWMAKFDETEKEEEKPEDGWVAVGKKKVQRATEEEQNEAKRKVAKKRKKDQLVTN